MREKRLFIFDLDGTLVDAYRAIEESLNFTLKSLGYAEVNLKKVKVSVGRGDKSFIRNFFPYRDIGQALDIYRRHHKRSLLRYSKLMPRAKYLLYLLKRKKKIVAIASNRPKYFTNLLLQKLKIKRYIDLCLCADEINALKPSPKIINVILKRLHRNREEAVFIGDMDIDLETAKRAHISAVFVKGGSSPLREVKKYKNKIIASNLKDILGLNHKG